MENENVQNQEIQIKVKVTRVSDTKKSVMIFLPTSGMATTNKFALNNLEKTNAYLTLPEDLHGKFSVGDEFDIPGGYKLVHAADADGVQLSYSDGTPIQFVKW